MKRWIVVLCLFTLAVSTPVVQAYSVAGSVTGGNPVGFPPHFKYAIAIPLRLDTANFLSNLALVNPLNNNYSFSSLDSGMYILFSFQDMNFNFLPDLDEPRGFWGADSILGIPAIMNLNHDTTGINIQLNPPNSGGFTGTLTYNGTQRGRAYVFACYDATLDTMRGIGTMLDTTTSGNGNYTALTDTFRTYYAYAFMDVNGNFQHDADEPYGVYGGSTPAQIHVQQSNFPSNVDITLHDPNVAGNPARPVPINLSLTSVYPNPFNNSTTVTFNVATSERIELSLYDVLGREVSVLARGSFSPGEHRLTLDGSGLSTGLYYLHLTGSRSTATRAVILLK
jgi:hypothetical protein